MKKNKFLKLIIALFRWTIAYLVFPLFVISLVLSGILDEIKEGLNDFIDYLLCNKK